MMKNEQQLADELDAFLTAKLKGQTLPVAAKDMESELKLASELIDLVSAVEADPDFLISLEAHLARVSRHTTSRVPSGGATNESLKRQPVWQKYISRVKEDTTMKRTIFALGTVAAVLIFAFVAWSARNNSQEREPSTIAGVTGNETVTTASPEALPTLPRLSADSGVMGMGGGGVESVSPVSQDTMMIMPDFTDIFSDTDFVLNTTLPVEPTTALVERETYSNFDLTMAQQVAARFGFTGPVYVQELPAYEIEAVEGIEPELFSEAPPSYFVFDGSRSLYMQSSTVSYSDLNVTVDYFNPISDDQAVASAEAFLKERGLLDFPYAVEASFGGTVNFSRFIDGRPVNQSEIYVQVGNNGQVAYAGLSLLAIFETLGSYPLRSAESAWQLIESGVGTNQIPYTILPNFEEESLLNSQQALDIPRNWSRVYQPGEEVHFYALPAVYLPAEGDGPPLIKILDFELRAGDSDLRAIAEHISETMHVWGHIGVDNRTIELTGWEVFPVESAINLVGTIQRENGEGVLHADTGEIYILPNIPADLPDGLSVYAFGWGSHEGDRAYPILNWQSLTENIPFPEPDVIDAPAPEEPIDMPVFEPFVYQQVTINEVELAYYYMPVVETLDGIPVPTYNTPPALLQPVWKFTGQTDTGEMVEFYVQAVAPEYLPAP